MKVKIFAISLLVAVICSSVSDGSSTLKSSKADNTKATKMPTENPKPDKVIPCVLRNRSCDYCTDDSSCFYCESESSCRKYESIKIVPRHCKGNKWFWRQCKVAGKIYLKNTFKYNQQEMSYV